MILPKRKKLFKKAFMKQKMEKPKSQTFEIAIAISLIMMIIFLLSAIFSLKPSFFLGSVFFEYTDKDSDYVNDMTEAKIGTDVLSDDTDRDGLTDGEEVNTYGTNPFEKDTDLDKMPDEVEIIWGSDPLNRRSVPRDIEDRDFDGDGLTDKEEETYHTDKAKKDTDNDNLTDGEEVNTLKTNPIDRDTDRDGLSDGGEVRWGLNPLDFDTDNDGKSDREEIYEYETNPFIGDPKQERGTVFKPLSMLKFQQEPIEPVEPEPVAPKPPKPMKPNEFPIICNYHPMNAIDSDSDTVPDEMEKFFATDPFNYDTDGDKFSDGDEIRNGYDPKVPVPKTLLFKDLKEEWQRQAIGELAYIVAIEGRLDTILDIEPKLRRNFEPDKYITRAEFLKIVLSLLQYICDEKLEPSENMYVDLRNTDWYYNIILLATKLDLIRGYPDHTIHANEYINRSEVAKIITLFTGLHRFEPIAITRDFTDVNINDWAYHFINILHERNIISGFADGSFHPYQPVTRAEAFQMLGKSFHFANDKLFRKLGEMENKSTIDN